MNITREVLSNVTFKNRSDIACLNQTILSPWGMKEFENIKSKLILLSIIINNNITIPSKTPDYTSGNRVNIYVRMVRSCFLLL